MKENKIDPPHQTAAPLQTIEFLCYTEITVAWFFQGGPLPLNAEEVRRSETRWSILKINNVILINAGTYTCVGEESKYVIFEADAVLSVQGKQILFFFTQNFKLFWFVLQCCILSIFSYGDVHLSNYKSKWKPIILINKI